MAHRKCSVSSDMRRGDIRLEPSNKLLESYEKFMTFKLYGYKNEKPQVEESSPLELAEVTLVANPIELRKIATFLLQAAEAIELEGEGWKHEHLSDGQPEFLRSPEFVVFNSSLKISNKV